MLELTDRTALELRKLSIEPNLVLQIEGIDELFGIVEILELIRIGDPELYIGDDWVIGGLRRVDEQADLIQLSGTTTSIGQQLRPDQGSVSSVSSMAVKLVDKNKKLTRYITPGLIVEDLLGRSAKIYIGMKNTAYPEDYTQIHAGFIDDIDAGAGFVKLNIAHPDQKKRQQVFFKRDANIASPMTNSQTTVPITSADIIFPAPYSGPGGVDSALKYYVRIDDEVMEYTGTSGAGLTGVVRGQLGTAQTTHASGQKAELIYVLEGNIVDLAQKIMLSGVSNYFVTAVPAYSFNQIDAFTTLDNAIFFRSIDVASTYGLVAGDFITVSGAANGANNFTLKTIVSIQSHNDGSYVIVDDSVSTVLEVDSAAVVSFRSKYDTLGIGLGMKPQEVDVEEHEYWKNLLLASISMRLYLKEDINGVDLIHKELYAPIGAYAVPRKGKCSLGYHIGPVPRGTLTVFDENNVRDASKIVLKRNINRHFYNTIIYIFDELSNEDRFVSGLVVTNEDSKSRIPVGTKAFKQTAKGLRRDLSASSVAEFVANRMLTRYKFAAEYFEKVKVFFKKGFNVEPGDNVLFDTTLLQISNTREGNRDRPARLMEVVNKSLDIKGELTVDLVDTNYDLSERYGLISPSSSIVSGTTTYAIIEDSFGELYPGNEQKKWTDYVGLPVLIHDETFTFQEEVVFTGFDSNDRYKMLFETPLSTPVLAGWIINIAPYSSSTDQNVNSKYKAVHAHLSPIVAVVTGVSTTQFTVGAGDVSKFQVGFPVLIHNDDFTDNSDELKVTDITGVTITVSEDMGFTPTSSHAVELLGFPDGQQCYRYI